MSAASPAEPRSSSSTPGPITFTIMQPSRYEWTSRRRRPG
jgi:hypothetical protein